MIKQKTCKICGTPFNQFKSTDKFCSNQCYYIHVGQVEIDKKVKSIKESIKFDNSHKTLQNLINSIVRLIDRGHACISSGKPFGQYTVHAGHFYSVGAFPALRYNLLNIFAQSSSENTHKSGNGVVYFSRIKEVFGSDVRDEIEGLVLKYPSLHLSKMEAHEACKKARNIIKGLESMSCPISTEMRISLRKRLNESLGIYK